MSQVNFPSISAYYTTPQTSWYTGPIDLRLIPSDSSDMYIGSLDQRYQYKPDLLSYDLYQTPGYYWVFMVRNMEVIRDPIWDQLAGISIYVPTLSRLQSLLGGSST